MAAERKRQYGAGNPLVIYPLKQYAACLSNRGKLAEARTALARAAAIEKDENVIPKFSKITMPLGSPERIAEGEKMRVKGEQLLACELAPKARAYFQRAIDLNPKGALALSDMGEVEAWSDQFGKAIADYTAAIRIKPDLHKAYVNRAFAHENLNDSAAAIADFDKAIALDPKDTESMGSRAKLLDTQGKHEAAIDAFSRIIAVNPKLYWPYIQRSNAYASIKQYKPAIEDLTTIIKRAPQDPDYYEFRAMIYKRVGDLKRALADYNKVVELNPKYSIGYHERARLYEKLDGKKSPRAASDDLMAKKLGYANK